MNLFVVGYSSYGGEKLQFPRIVQFAGGSPDESIVDKEVKRRNEAEKDIPENDRMVWVKIPIPLLK